MSEGDWMSDAKTGRVVAGVIVTLNNAFVIGSLAKYDSERESQRYQQQAQTDPENSASAKTPVINVAPYAAPDYHPCEPRDDDDWEDLCQQWRMAESAKDLTNLTKTQIGVTFVEITFLLAVLFYTAKATLSAAEANRLSQQALIAERRPWIDASVIITGPLTVTDQGASISIEVESKNIGQTPVVDVWIDQRMFICGLGPVVTSASQKVRTVAMVADEYWDSVKGRLQKANTGLSTIFPNSDIPVRISFVSKVERNILDAALVPIPPEQPQWIMPCIGICVSYRSTSDRQIHETRRLYRIDALAAKGRPGRILLDSQGVGSLDQKKIAITEYPG